MAFDQAIADKICDRLATEPVSLQAILREPKMPKSSQVYEWLQKHPSFAENYARAREAQGDVDADAIAAIRQDMLDGKVTPEQARVAIDSLKWSAGKRKPKVYGDRIDHTHDVTSRIVLVDARSAASGALDATAQLVTQTAAIEHDKT